MIELQVGNNLAKWFVKLYSAVVLLVLAWCHTGTSLLWQAQRFHGLRLGNGARPFDDTRCRLPADTKSNHLLPFYL